MKTLENFELHELTMDETQQIAGGTWWWYIGDEIVISDNPEKVEG